MANRLTDSEKPEFDALYGYLACFLTPFIELKTTALVWNTGESTWVSEKNLNNSI